MAPLTPAPRKPNASAGDFFTFSTLSGINYKKIIIFVPDRVYFIRKVNYLYPYGIIFKDMTIGEYIKDKRKQFKLTQIELAERSGVGVRFVRELERGKTTVQLDKVNQVLELFGETLYPKRIND